MAYKNPQDQKDYSKKYYQDHKEEKKVYSKEYARLHPEEIKKYRKIYNDSHREQKREYTRKYTKTEGRRTSLQNYRRKCRNIYRYRLDSNMGCSIWKSLKGKKAGRKWETLVGYTVEDLIKHLETKFETWMNWDNYGEWHIDHIKPKSLFIYEKPEDSEFKKCWSLENLQPLEANENRSKGNAFVDTSLT